ncbi:MAG: DNRLRE domain-containing protein [Candidatus Aenigmatarchaeota archaeon]|nr:MAG: DNRLRE domain-containing protein [Candidatus Aenigmarchaeota archaeon]
MNGKLIVISSVLLVLVISVVSIGSAAKPPKGDPGIESGPGIIKADSGDGFIKYRKGTFNSVDTTSDIQSGYDDVGGPNYDWYRAYVQFDVSSLSNATSIDSATLYFRVASDNINTANILELQYLSWDGNLDSSDWGITERETITGNFPGEETPGNWEAIDVTSQLSDAVITREESTFSVRIKHDTEPGDGSTDNYMTWYSSEDSGSEPYIRVTYTEAPPVYGTLQVDLTAPGDNFEVSRFDVFNLNVTVSCVGEEGAICGTVDASAMYNESSTDLDTLISTTEGAAPFYLVGTGSGEFVNFTDGFSQPPGAQNVMGCAYDPTDDTFWLTDTTDDYAYHVNKTGDDLGDGHDLGADGLDVPAGITFDSSDDSYWVANQDYPQATLHHYNSSWGDLTDDIDLDAAGSDGPEGVAYDPTDDTLWVVDILDDFVYHFNASNGAKLTDGFDVSAAGVSWPSGIGYDPSDDTLWITDATDNFMYHFDKEGNNLTDGFDLLNLAGSDLPEAVGFDTTDNTFWVPDDEDFFVYHVGPGGAEAENPISQTLSQGQDFKVSWTVNATGLSGTQYEIGVKASSSISGVSENSSSVTVCIGTC